MQNLREKQVQAFIKFLDTLDALHGPQGCPWDKEQSHQSLRPYVLEEAYEVVEAIDTQNPDNLKEELGDLLLQVLFHSKIASLSQVFGIDDVMEGISEKLIRRHPHVFADTKVKNSTEVRQNWEKIKEEEKKVKRASILHDIPSSLPALLRAYKIGKKVSKVGFDWPDLKGVLSKVKEEIQELEQGIQNQNQDEILEEMGDLLFSIANLSRFLNVNPEEALRQTNAKFIRRFEFIEKKLREQKKSFDESSLEEMDHLWNEAKKQSTKTV